MNNADIIIDSLLMQNSFIPVNISLGNRLGLYETIFVSFIFYHKNKLRMQNLDREWIPLPQNLIMQECPFFTCEKRIQRTVNNLIAEGIISIKRVNSPPVNHFKIHRDVIVQFLVESSPYKDDLPKRDGEENVKVDKDLVKYILNRYNSLSRLGALPELVSTSQKRMSAVNTRVKEHPSREYWKNLFDKLKQDTFLWRKNNPDASWLTFDFIFRAGSADKILEGKYDFKIKEYVDMSCEENNPELILQKNETQTALKHYKKLLSMEKLKKKYNVATERVDGLFEIALASEILAEFQDNKHFNYGVSNYASGDNFFIVFVNYLSEIFKKLELITPNMILQQVVPFLKHVEEHGGNINGILGWDKDVWRRVNGES